MYYVTFSLRIKHVNPILIIQFSKQYFHEKKFVIYVIVEQCSPHPFPEGGGGTEKISM